MVKHALTIALVKSVLQVLDHMGPTGARHRRRHPRHHGCIGRRHLQQQPEVSHRSMPLTLGSGFLNDLLHLPLIHRPIGRWNPQIRLTLRGVDGNRLASSTVWARAHTRLRKGNRCFQHRVKGKEKKKKMKPSEKKKMMTWSSSPS
jgi:hypothetical protein